MTIFAPNDYNIVLSAICNAIDSGLSITELRSCIMLGSSAEEIDAAISAAIRMKEIMKND